MQIQVKTTDTRLAELKRLGECVNGPIRLQLSALLDTGASMTTLDEEFVDRLKLAPSGQEQFFLTERKSQSPRNAMRLAS